tara:strand:- start:6237 stop:6983 length:747 start_codon:yes stop_codon:yes gene_type:complete
MDNEVLEQTFAQVKGSFRNDFDDRLYIIRRNLMLSSTVAIAISFVEPLKDGTYEVNMGLLKGSLQQPELLYGFVLLGVIYHWCWFHSHIKSIQSNSFFNLKDNFFRMLGANYAGQICLNVSEEAHKRDPNIPKITFFSSKSNISSNGRKFVFSQTLTENLYVVRKLEAELVQKGIEVNLYENKAVLEYTFVPKIDDFIFLNSIKWHNYVDATQKLVVMRVPQIYALISMLFISGRFFDYNVNRWFLWF